MAAGDIDNIRTGVRDDETRQTLQQLRKIFKAEPYVPKSMFNANTILKADTDNTPEALTVAEQSIVGRAAGEIDDIAVGTNELVGRAGGNLGTVAVGTNEVVARGSANIAPVSVATNTLVGRAAGDIDDLAVGTNEVVARGSANIAPVAMDTNTVLARAAGDIEDIAVGEDTVVGRVAGGNVTALELVTATETIDDPGSDSKIPTEAAVRAAITAIPTASGSPGYVTWGEFFVLAGLP